MRGRGPSPSVPETLFFGAWNGPVFKVVVLCLGLVVLGGCMRGCTSRRPPIHIVPDMDHQEKYLPQAESGFFQDGAVMQRPVEGTVARGQLMEDTEFYTGRDEAGSFVANPVEITAGLAERGYERYQIFCTPCHGERGDGQGMLAVRAGVPVPSLFEQRLRQMPDGEMFEVISDGLGLMPGYRYPIPPLDRWAIIAQVRRLQEEAGNRQ